MHESLRSLLKNADMKMTENRQEITRRVWNLCFEKYKLEFTNWEDRFYQTSGEFEDMVEFIMECEECFDIEIPDEEAEKIHTFEQLILCIIAKIEGEIRFEEANCYSQALFYICRKAMINSGRFMRNRITPDTKITQYFLAQYLSPKILSITTVNTNDTSKLIISLPSLPWNLLWGTLCLLSLAVLVPIGLSWVCEFAFVGFGIGIYQLAKHQQEQVWKEQTVSLREVIAYVTAQMDENGTRLVRRV
jgi:hypothetical protein